MVKTSVLMTVHDREPEILLPTLRSLHRSGLDDIELIIVDDRSDMDYSWVKPYATPRFSVVKWATTGDYEGHRLNGYGNPSKAFNTGLFLATGDRLIVMSSDVIVTSDAVKSMDRHWTPACGYTPRVMDLDTQIEYCGPTRPFPMPWFLVLPTKDVQEMGGWDEQFLAGYAFEDNDFVGRIALKLGTILCDWVPVVYHQTHERPGGTDNYGKEAPAFERNRDLCMKKWGGIPFDSEFTPFTLLKKLDASGCSKLEVVNEGLKEKWFGVKV